jgi:hypothetical protein
MPAPLPAPKAWNTDVTVAPDPDQRLTPGQCPVLYDMAIQMRQRLDDLAQEEARLLAALDLARREQTAIQPAYTAMLAFVIPDSIENALKVQPAQEVVGPAPSDTTAPPLSTPA